MNEITLLFRNNNDHEGFNKQLLSFLTDMHTKLNDNGYIINPIIVSKDNIDKYAKLGVSSLPALLDNDNNQENGVNAIIAYLSLKTQSDTTSNKNKAKQKFQNLIDEVSNISLEELKREESRDNNNNVNSKLDILTQDDILKATKKFDYINKKQQQPLKKKSTQNNKETFREQNTKFNNMDADEIKVLQSYINDTNDSDEDEVYMPDYN